MSKIRPLEILLYECTNFEKDIIENKNWTKKNILLLISLLKNIIESQIDFEVKLEEIQNHKICDKNDSNLLSIPIENTDSDYEESEDSSDDLDDFIVKDQPTKKPKNQKPI